MIRQRTVITDKEQKSKSILSRTCSIPNIRMTIKFNDEPIIDDPPIQINLKIDLKNFHQLIESLNIFQIIHLYPIIIANRLVHSL